MRLETLVNEIARRDAIPQEVAAALPEGANEAEWQTKVEKAAARTNRLGPINLAAIDEHAKASERKQYLDAQNADLEAALETLKSAIRKIDKETRQRFKEPLIRLTPVLLSSSRVSSVAVPHALR